MAVPIESRRGELTICALLSHTPIDKRWEQGATARPAVGHARLLVLKTVARGPAHGYGIVQHLRTSSGDVLQAGEGVAVPGAPAAAAERWVRAALGCVGAQPPRALRHPDPLRAGSARRLSETRAIA